MKEYGVKNKAETIRQALYDAIQYNALPKVHPKPILPAAEKVEEKSSIISEKVILPPPGFSKMTPPAPPVVKTNKEKIAYWVNQGMSMTDALQAVRNGK
jgi:hypothetical protein